MIDTLYGKIRNKLTKTLYLQLLFLCCHSSISFSLATYMCIFLVIMWAFLIIHFYFMFIGVLLACLWGYQKPWNWSYTQLWAVVWVLGIEPGSSGRTASALNLWATSVSPKRIILCLYFLQHPPPQDSVSLWCSRCPGTHYCRPSWPWMHRDLFSSVSQVLELKACATTHTWPYRITFNTRY